MQITLPDDPRFQATAAAAGFASVEEYVVAFLKEEVATEPKHQKLSHDQWKRKLMSLRERFRSCSPDFDDSRESIYPVRD